MLRPSFALLLTTLALTGCSTSDDPPLDVECIQGPDPIAEALRTAPGAVALRGGTPLSECVSRARSDGDLQNVGASMTQVAEQLEADADEDPQAAIRLGYLLGAARRGAGSASAIQAELVRRLERSVAGAQELGPEVARGLREGMAAGEARG